MSPTDPLLSTCWYQIPILFCLPSFLSYAGRRFPRRLLLCFPFLTLRLALCSLFDRSQTTIEIEKNFPLFGGILSPGVGFDKRHDMAANELLDRSLRSSQSPRSETSPESYRFRRYKIKPRQAPPSPIPPPSSSDSDSDDDTSDDSDSESDDDDVPNPFAPSPPVRPEATRSIAATQPATTSSLSDSPIPTISSLTTSYSSSFTTRASPTTFQISPASATGIASVGETADVTTSSKQNHNTAVALGSVLAVVSTAVVAFLLYRYCVPLRKGLARARRRRRGEETNLETLEKGPGPLPQEEALNQSKNAPPGDFIRKLLCKFQTTPERPTSPEFTMVSAANPEKDRTSKSLPLIPNTSPPSPPRPQLFETMRSEDDPNNPFSDKAETLSKINSKRGTPKADLDGKHMSQTTTSRQSEQYTSGFNTSNSRSTRTSLATSVHRVSAVPVVPLPTGFGFGLGLDENLTATNAGTPRTALFNLPYMPPTELVPTTTSDMAQTTDSPPSEVQYLPSSATASPKTPDTAHFTIPYAPPSAPATPRSQYYIPRIRKSITPSESISNAPYSPLPFPAELRPPLPVNSRWSQNSSSACTRPTRDDDRTTSPIKRTLSRKPLPPQLPLAIRTSTSSSDSMSSRGSRRMSGSTTFISPSPVSVAALEPKPLAPRPQIKIGSMVIGLPTSVRPPSHAAGKAPSPAISRRS